MKSLVLLLAVAGQALAWGTLGHMTAAYLGEKLLTKEAADWANDLLANDKGYDWGDAGTYADRVRFHRPETAPWHFLDANDDPPGQCGIKWPSDCTSDPKHPGCVVTAVANMTGILTEGSASKSARAEALMFLIHFVADITQPLHTEALERGGNGILVEFDGHAGQKLHAVWDSLIPQRVRGMGLHPAADELRSEAQTWAGELAADQTRGVTHEADTSEDCAVSAQACALRWAGLSNQFVCTAVLAPGVDWLESHDVLRDGDYFAKAQAVVNAQLRNAGVRIALMVNSMERVARSAPGGTDL